MKRNFIPSLRLTAVFLLFFSGFYTLAVWAAAQLAPGQGNGITLTENGKTYYPNIGEAFTQDRYFWSRPSAVGYDAAGSGASNKGITNPAYLATVKARIDTFLFHDPGVRPSEIPSDLVTASASGLDPDISVQAAKVQVNRIARLRHLNPKKLYGLIARSTEPPFLGYLGPEKINVLKLNLALDQLK